jgi:DNA-binding transcriptional LysR family regulator
MDNRNHVRPKMHRPTRTSGPTVEQARAFCAVARRDTYRGAAKDLGFSDHIAVIKLVDRFGKALGRDKLVSASARGQVTLTSAGEAVLPAAKRFTAAAEALGQNAREVRLACYPAMVARIMRHKPNLLPKSDLVLADVREESRRDGGRGLVQAVVDGEVDIAVAPSDIELGDLTERRLYRWNLRLHLPRAHRLATRRILKPGELSQLHIAAAPWGHRSREKLEGVFALADLQLHVALESASQEVLYAVADASSDYVAVLPDDFEGPTREDLGPLLSLDGNSAVGGEYSMYARPAAADEMSASEIANAVERLAVALH